MTAPCLAITSGLSVTREYSRLSSRKTCDESVVADYGTYRGHAVAL